MAQVLRYTVPSAFDGATVEQFLRRGAGLSSHMIVRLRHAERGIESEGVQLWTIHRVRAGQVIQLNFPEDAVRIEGADLPLSVVYEDARLLVVDKPPYIAEHPSADKTDPTVANAVVAHYAACGAPASFRPTNRLDRNTSGLLLIAKDAHAAYSLTGQAKKAYLAVATGCLVGSGTVDAPIRRREGSIIAREVGDGGKPSVTHWEALGCDGQLTLLRVVIDTGRTHQIRVHMAHLGHPLAGDTLYGNPDTAAHPIARQALHCAEINVPHPDTGEPLRFESPLPPDMAALVQERSLL